MNSFAIAEQQGVLGIVTAWTVIGANSASLMNMDLAIDLKAVQAKFAGDAHKLVSTCGGLFGVVGTKRFPGWSNLLTGPGVPPNPYAWFRCSSDRSVIAGIVESNRALYVGADRETQVAPRGGAAYYEFNVSPNGKYLAYASDRQPLCVWRAGVSECASADATDSSHDLVSVRDDGEVLVALATRDLCVYKSDTVFSPARANDKKNTAACPGIAHWRSGMKSPEIIEWLGRAPQWISPDTANLLLKWSHTTKGQFH